MSTHNKSIKRNLVYAYRIIAKLGLDDHTYTHLSSRSEAAETFYIHKFGLRFEEVTENDLISITADGKNIGSNETGYIIHSAIYKHRPDISHVFHLHTPYSVAVSALVDGLLPISQWALHFYKCISYHDYNSLALESDEGIKLVKSLKHNNIMFLRNHGFITCGKTIQEAMFYTYHLEQACKTQCLTLAMNRELVTIPEEVCARSVGDLLSFEENLGERDWEAWLRFIAVDDK